MHVATGHSIGTITSDIEAYHALAKEAAFAVHEEFEAIQQLYSKILDRYRAQSHDGWRISDLGKTFDEADKGESWTVEDQGIQSTVTVVPQAVDSSPSELLAGERKYIQVVVDCASLKFILDPAKRGYQSATQLIADLSDLIDRYLSPDDDDAVRDGTGTGSSTPKAGSSTLDREFPDRQIEFEPVEVATSIVPPTAAAPTLQPIRNKRFTFLIDPVKMIDKNYPLRKDKARTFIAGLHDAPGSELVHVGLGKKTVEEHMRQIIDHHLSIDQCAHIFVAVGITSNNMHHVLNLSRPTLSALARHPAVAAPAQGKLSIMRSGGPFDKSLGIGSVAIDKYLSVQVQVPGMVNRQAGAAGREDGYGERDRRSFAPSPPGGSKRVLRPTEKNQEGGGGPIVGASASSGSLACKSGVGEDAFKESTGGVTGLAKSDSRDTSVASPRASTSPPEVLSTFDPLAIQKTFGKPLCAKYHLNRGICQCRNMQDALHDQVTLEPMASKQLAVWAADKTCPEGTGCPDAQDRKCCFWFHEPRGLASAGSGDVNASGSMGSADEWIAVDKKGKPIVAKTVQAPRAWEPSASCQSYGKLVRNDFHPLLATIRQFERERNEYKHERGLIGTELKRAYGHDLYRRLALSGFREYTGLAEKAGLIKLGYFGESAGWIALA